MDADLEYANRAVAQMQRCLDAARADVARLVREVQEMAARVDEMRAERDRALVDAGAGEAAATQARLERDELRAVATSVLEACGMRAVAPAHAPEVVAAKLREARERADRAEAERDETRAMYLAAVGLADSLSERLRRAEAERDAAKAARALPGGRDPGVPLPVVPATCGECANVRPTFTDTAYCAEMAVGVLPAYVCAGKEPPPWCPIRAELAKVTP